MRIDDMKSDQLGSSSTRPAQPVRRSAPAAPAPAGAAPTRRDSVEISEQAKALAATAEGDAVQGALDPERLAEMRRWLAAGGHNDPAVLRKVAEKLIDGGELTGPAEGNEG